ncbi:MAG: hypothetical protein ABIH34_01735 [Nanoarchaeota archaeon]
MNNIEKEIMELGTDRKLSQIVKDMIESMTNWDVFFVHRVDRGESLIKGLEISDFDDREGELVLGDHGDGSTIYLWRGAHNLYFKPTERLWKELIKMDQDVAAQAFRGIIKEQFPAYHREVENAYDFQYIASCRHEDGLPSFDGEQWEESLTNALNSGLLKASLVESGSNATIPCARLELSLVEKYVRIKEFSRNYSRTLCTSGLGSFQEIEKNYFSERLIRRGYPYQKIRRELLQYSLVPCLALHARLK